MKRSVEILGGGVLGLALGTVFLANPNRIRDGHIRQGHVEPGRMSVGDYTLASTAQLLSGGPVYNATRPFEFRSLTSSRCSTTCRPARSTVSASLRRGDGGGGGRAVQTVTTEDGVATTSVALRSRTPSQPVKGTAGPRWPAASAPDSLRSARRRPQSRRLRSNQSIGSAAPRPVIRNRRTARMASRRVDRLSDPDGLESGWHQVQLLDLDGDGLVDEIRIEPPNGTAVVWRLVPQRLSVRKP